MTDSTTIRGALAAEASSTRLRAALAAGTAPDSALIEPLIVRCAVEPDFYVRDMLTWALTRHDRDEVVPQVLSELGSPVAQARSQALHTLSKIGDPATWSAITTALLKDSDDEVARTAWRAAAGLAPAEERLELAEVLATQFDRGDRDLQRSLSRAFSDLGDAALPVVELATQSDDDGIRTHAIATATIMEDPDEGFEAAMAEARRAVALRAAPEIAE